MNVNQGFQLAGDEEILRTLHTLEHYLPVKVSEVLTSAASWMKLENIRLVSEKSQIQRSHVT